MSQVTSAEQRKLIVLDGINRAFAALLEIYRRQGGWRYPGSLDADEGYGWMGPLAWSEADYQHLFARLLEAEFPGWAHLEVPIRAGTFANLPAPSLGKKPTRSSS